MPTIYEMIAEFKRKYPMTIGWRYEKNARIIEKHLNPNERSEEHTSELQSH